MLKKTKFLLMIVTGLVLISPFANAQTDSDKNYYLVDSLELSQLTKTDSILLDSCLKEYYKAKHDTDKINVIRFIVKQSWDDKVWPKYNWWVYHFVQRKLKEELPSDIKLHLQISLASALHNIGFLYSIRGSIEKALDYYDRSIKIKKEVRDGKGIAFSLNNIGLIYEGQGDVVRALNNYREALMLNEELGNQRGTAICLNNIGALYFTGGKIDSALYYYQKSLNIKEAINDKKGVGLTLNNIAQIYKLNGNFELALNYFNRSLAIKKEIGDQQGIAVTSNNIGDIYLRQGNSSEAKKWSTESLKLALELRQPNQIKSTALLLSRIAVSEKDYKKALEMYELHIEMRDSLKNEETQKATIRQQTKYEFEKAALIKEQEEKEATRLAEEETSRRDNLQYSIILLGLLILGALVLGLGRLNISVRMAEGLIFFSFLILFEFLLVLADPYIEDWSGGAPGIKLLFNAGIAALIFPLHAFFEAKLKGRLVKT